jgi:hypothetical protein
VSPYLSFYTRLPRCKSQSKGKKPVKSDGDAYQDAQQPEQGVASSQAAADSGNRKR